MESDGDTLDTVEKFCVVHPHAMLCVLLIRKFPPKMFAYWKLMKIDEQT